MCGVAGIVSLDGQLSKMHTKHTERMLQAIRHRGPDEHGVHAFKDAVIGNVRLSIVGGDGGRQPVSKHTTGLVFNGEIYNYRDLSEKYRLTQVPDSDTRVLFACLERQQMAILPELNGVFGFCFVSDDTIFIARDRFGEKPLYYTVRDKALYFASEIKALLLNTSAEIELPSLYPELETPVGQATIFAGVKQVEPGTYLAVDRRSGALTVHRYYELSAIPHAGPWDEQVYELKTLVSDAISLRLPDKLPYGIYASGGLDSSIIASTTRPHALITSVPGNSDVPSEVAFADLLAQKVPAAAYLKVAPDPTTILQDLIGTIYVNDGPATTLAAYTQYILARRAHEHGLRVVLSGMGADEFFGGYARHAVALLPPDLLHADIVEHYRDLIQKRHEGFGPARFYAAITNRGHEESDDLYRLIEEVFTKYKDPLAAISVCEAFLSLPPLLATDDRVNMAFGVESRSPLLDYRVVEFGLSLPLSSKIHGQKDQLSLKHILRTAFKDALPAPIYNRKDKVGFTSHVNNLLRSSWRPFVGESVALLQSAYPNEQYYRLEQLRTGQFDRWHYQIVQLAITHLLFCEGYSQDKVLKRLTACMA